MQSCGSHLYESTYRRRMRRPVDRPDAPRPDLVLRQAVALGAHPAEVVRGVHLAVSCTGSSHWSHLCIPGACSARRSVRLAFPGPARSS